MTTIRVEKVENYSIIANGFLNDPDLSYQEIGLLTFLLSKPNTWKVNVQHLTNSHTNGRDSVYAIIKSLGEKGYIEREQPVGESGQFAPVSYVVRESPVGKTASGLSVSGSAVSGSTVSGKARHLVITEGKQGLSGEMTEPPRARETADFPQPGPAPQPEPAARSGPGSQMVGSRKNPPTAPEVQNAAAAVHRLDDLAVVAAAYPAHRRPSSADVVRRAAVKAAWCEAIDARELPPTDALLADLARRGEGYDWQKEGQRYVPTLHNYLIKRMWTHPIAPPPEPRYRTVADMNKGGTGRLVL